MPREDVNAIEVWLSYEKQALEARKVVEKNITRVLKVMCEIYGQKLKYWFVYDAPEGERGNLSKCIGKKDINGLDIEASKDSKLRVGIFQGEEWELGDGFPIYWLDMETDELRKEIETGKRTYEEKEAREKKEAEAKRLANKIQREAIKKTALSKLSREERKALGVK